MAQPRSTALQRWLLAPTLLAPTLLAAAIALRSAPAGACSYLLQALDASYPAPDAEQVPTNAVLFAYGHELNSEGTLRLLDASGAEVPVQVLPVEPSGFDVRPLAPLEPERAYQLHATGRSYAVPSVVSFSTGSGPAAVPDDIETPVLDLAVLMYPAGICGAVHRVCVDTALSPGTTLEVRVGEEVLRQTLALEPSSWYGAYASLLQASDCVEVRARDVRGRRSAPNIVCGADVPRIEVPSESTSRYSCENFSALTQDPNLESSSDPDPDLVENPAPVVTTSSAAEGDLPGPRDVTYGASGSDRAATGGCQLTDHSAMRSSAATLSIGLIALLSMRRRRAR